MNQLPLFTTEDEHELVELLARLAQNSCAAASQEMAEEEQSPADAAPLDQEEHDRGGYWLKDWQDIVSEEVCVPRWGPI